MFGFVNLILAAAFIRKGMQDKDVCALLECEDTQDIVFRESRVSWRGEDLNRDDMRMSRAQLFLSFGSCSFTEPVDEARALGLI